MARAETYRQPDNLRASGQAGQGGRKVEATWVEEEKKEQEVNENGQIIRSTQGRNIMREKRILNGWTTDGGASEDGEELNS